MLLELMGKNVLSPYRDSKQTARLPFRLKSIRHTPCDCRMGGWVGANLAKRVRHLLNTSTLCDRGESTGT